MKKLDRYILYKFLSTFIFCLLLFTVIAMAVDSSERTDDFVKSGLTTMQLIRQYYFGFVPFIWGLLFPLFVFLAVIYFTSRMATRSEIIAILASGVSFKRFLRPYIVGGLLLASIMWLATNFVIPKANRIKSNFESKFINMNDPGKSLNYSAVHYFRADSNSFVGIRYFDTANQSSGIMFLNRLKKDKIVYNLRAESMKWDTSKHNWKLVNVTERRVDSMSETVSFLPEMNINLNIKPEELAKDNYLKEKLTTPDLRKFILNEEQRGSEGLNTYKVEKYRRDASAASVFILSMIGVFISSRKVRGGSGVHMAIGIIIASVYIMSDRFSSVFSIKGNLSPLLAAWLPNIVFSIIALWLFRKALK